MKKKLTLLITLLLTAALLVGCTGTPVIYHSGDCDCPEAGNTLSPAPSTPSEPADNQPAADQPAADQPAVEGAVKTGLAIVASTEGSADASAEADGTAKFDVTLVAVTVDDTGVIQDCIIDNMNPSLSFNAKGEIAAPAEVLTKAELGDMAKDDDDVLSYIAFPQVAERFFEERKAKEERKVKFSIEAM